MSDEIKASDRVVVFSGDHIPSRAELREMVRQMIPDGLVISTKNAVVTSTRCNRVWVEKESDTAIARWNADVDRRKADKKAAKNSPLGKR